MIHGIGDRPGLGAGDLLGVGGRHGDGGHPGIGAGALDGVIPDGYPAGIDPILHGARVEIVRYAPVQDGLLLLARDHIDLMEPPDVPVQAIPIPAHSGRLAATTVSTQVRPA